MFSLAQAYTRRVPEVDPVAEQGRLYGLPLEKFVAERNGLAQKLRAAKLPDVAKQVRSLRRPSIGAWGINQLVRQSPELYDRLVAAGDRLRSAQAGTDTAIVREATTERRAAIDKARRRVLMLLKEAGSAASPALERRIGTSLEAIAAFGSAPGAPPRGCLEGDLEPPDFSTIQSLAATAQPLPSSDRDLPTEIPPDTEIQGAQEGVSEAGLHADLRRRSVRSAEEALRFAELRAEAARSELAEADRRQDAARSRLRAAEDSELEARRQLASAQADAHAADRRLLAAREGFERIRSGRGKED